MATIINNPQPTTNSGNNGMGFLLGVILLIAVVALFLYYGLPYLRGGMGTQVSIPDHVNVNIQHSTKK